jgi:hypothetical protein
MYKNSNNKTNLEKNVHSINVYISTLVKLESYMHIIFLQTCISYLRGVTIKFPECPLIYRIK